MRLIDIDALIEKHCEGCSEDIQEGCKTDPVCATLMWFEEAPTIDAEPVVRCKDCDKSKPSNMCGDGWCFCHNNFQHHKEDHFCGYGERRETDG